MARTSTPHWSSKAMPGFTQREAAAGSRSTWNSKSRPRQATLASGHVQVQPQQHPPMVAFATTNRGQIVTVVTSPPGRKPKPSTRLLAGLLATLTAWMVTKMASPASPYLVLPEHRRERRTHPQCAAGRLLSVEMAPTATASIVGAPARITVQSPRRPELY